MSDDYTVTELLNMDEAEARQTLTVDEYESWESLHDLNERADETEAEWEGQRETVEDLVVRADREALGTRVDIFGNELLVRINPEDEAFRDAAETLDDEFGDLEESLDELSDERVEELAGYLLDMFDAALLEWNGTPWDEVPDPDRQAVLADAREQWGLDGLFEAWMDMAVAINEEREDKMDVVEQFRGAGRRGHR